MRLLSTPFEPEARGRRNALRPLLPVAGLALGVAAGGWALDLAGAPLGLGRAVAGLGVHGGFLVLAWMLVAEGRADWRRPALRLVGALAGAFLASRLHPWGAGLFLLVPVLLAWEGRRRPWGGRLGLGWPARALPVAVGLLTGGFLGVHLLVAASRTLGYAVTLTRPAAFLSAWAYDLGANVLSAECLFRGAVFPRLWRRWSFWPAALGSTALAVGRYLLDPALPRALEVAAGAVFYVALLGVSGCALRAWSGSLLPGYLAAALFFAAYRLLGP